MLKFFYTSCLFILIVGTLCVNFPPVQQQSGYDDCGVFAISFAVHRALEENVSSLKINQKQMRKHLDECLRDNPFKAFPHRSYARRWKKLKYKDILLYCNCNMPETFGNMVECELCKGWYHQKCIGYTCRSHWICNSCYNT